MTGLLIGFAGSTLAYRYRLLRVPEQGMMHRMDRELKLTPAQHEQIAQMMEDSRLKMAEMHRDFHRRRRQLLSQAREQIRAILTPEQQQEFDRSFALERGPEEGHEPRHP